MEEIIKEIKMKGSDKKKDKEDVGMRGKGKGEGV